MLLSPLSFARPILQRMPVVRRVSLPPFAAGPSSEAPACSTAEHRQSIAVHSEFCRLLVLLPLPAPPSPPLAATFLAARRSAHQVLPPRALPAEPLPAVWQTVEELRAAGYE